MLENREKLKKRKESDLCRKRRVIKRIDGNIMSLDNRDAISFCSNDYLGLASHPYVMEAVKKSVAHYGLGGRSSQMLCGYTEAHLRLEEELADFFGVEKALLFSTGYTANLGVISAFAEKESVIFIDKLCHASIIDGCRLSQRKFKRYLHGDIRNLHHLLMKSERGKKLIFSEGVFSMGGDLAPLSSLVELKKKYNANLIIDDAHGIGVLGEKGRGTIEYFGVVLDDLSLLIGTFGKAFGGFGAFVVGSEQAIDYLIQFCRTFTYTTALPPAIVEANRAALKILKKEAWRRARLREGIDYFKKGASQLELPLMLSITAIQSILIGSSKTAVLMGEELIKQGMWVSVIRPPTVPPHTARLRVSLNVFHTRSQIDSLLEAFSALFQGEKNEVSL